MGLRIFRIEIDSLAQCSQSRIESIFLITNNSEGQPGLLRCRIQANRFLEFVFSAIGFAEPKIG